MIEESFNRIIELIEQRKNNAFLKINEELILMYLDVGKFLYNLQQNSKHGDKITTKAAEFMKNNYPNIKGFTKRNIERMVQFYKIYKDDEIATPLVTQLSWTNNLLILSGSKEKDVVEYSISKNMSQTLISEYKLKLIDKKILESKLKEVKDLIIK